MSTIPHNLLTCMPLLKNLKESQISIVISFRLHHNRLYLFTSGGNTLVFGDNSTGLLGLGHSRPVGPIAESVQALAKKKIIDVASGIYHCLALSASGQVYTWGKNCYGQLGTGDTRGSLTPKLIIKKGAVMVRAGSEHSMVLTNEGILLTFGSNQYGRIGTGSQTPVYHVLPLKVSSLIGHIITTIECGHWHSVVLTNQGRAFGWGANGYGQIGLGHCENSVLTPKQVKLPQDETMFKAVACSAFFTLFLTENGEVFTSIDGVGIIKKVAFFSNIPKVTRVFSVSFRYWLPGDKRAVMIATTEEDTVVVWNTWKKSHLVYKDLTVIEVLKKHAEFVAMPEVVKIDFRSTRSTPTTNIPALIQNGTKLSESSSSSFASTTKSISNGSVFMNAKLLSSKALLPKIATLFDDPESADVKFYFPTENKTIYAHQSLLKIFSKYMRSKLADVGLGQVVTISKPGYKVYYNYLKFLYTGNIENLCDRPGFLVDLLHLSNEVGEIKEIGSKCLEQFEKSFEPKTCCDIFQVAHEYQLEELEKIALNYIVDNFAKVILEDSYLCLKPANMKIINLRFSKK